MLLNPAAVGLGLSWTAHSVWLGASRGGAGVPESRGRRSGERWDTCSPRKGPPRTFSEAAETETAAQATEPRRPEAGSASSWASLLCLCVFPVCLSPHPRPHRVCQLCTDPGPRKVTVEVLGVRTPSVGRVRAHSPARDGSRHGAGLSASCGKAVCERGFQPRGANVPGIVTLAHVTQISRSPSPSTCRLLGRRFRRSASKERLCDWNCIQIDSFP